MTQTIERLELSPEIYRVLEQVAQGQGCSVSCVVENSVRHSHPTEVRQELMREYHNLVDKDLAGNATNVDKQRIKEIATQVHEIDKQKMGKIWAKREKMADDLLAKSEQLLTEIRSKREN